MKKFLSIMVSSFMVFASITNVYAEDTAITEDNETAVVETTEAEEAVEDEENINEGPVENSEDVVADEAEEAAKSSPVSADSDEGYFDLDATKVFYRNLGGVYTAVFTTLFTGDPSEYNGVGYVFSDDEAALSRADGKPESNNGYGIYIVPEIYKSVYPESGILITPEDLGGNNDSHYIYGIEVTSATPGSTIYFKEVMETVDGSYEYSEAKEVTLPTL